MKSASVKTAALLLVAALSLSSAAVYGMGQKEKKGGCTACGEKAKLKMHEFPVVDAQAAHQLWQGNKAHFVDALSPDSYAKGHVPGAVNIPSSDLDNTIHRLSNAAKDDVIIVYCANPKCGAAKKTASYLKEKGYSQIYYFQDGIQGWKKHGYDVQS